MPRDCVRHISEPFVRKEQNAMVFRDFTPNDIELFSFWLHKNYIAKWYNDPEDWLHEVSSDEFSFVHHFIVEEDGRPIGFCQYYDYGIPRENWHGTFDITDTYSIDYLIGEEAFLGKGYGARIVKCLIEKVFAETNAQKIIVKPEDDNTASCNTLLSAGFVKDESNNIFLLQRASICK
jgi:RimJ/RimL family protein N-acetyltransferase